MLSRLRQLTLHLATTSRRSSSLAPIIMSIPDTVEALTIPHTGGVEVIQKTTIPFKRNPGDLVIKVDYCGINFIDSYYRHGLYKYSSFPAVLGKETSGTIVALPTDPKVLEDPVFQKRGFEVGGKVAADFLGSHATYISVPPKFVYSVPDAVSTKIAAAAALQGLTAVTFTEEGYDVKKGDVILVHTVAGGLGLLFSQIIKSRGATVIGTTSTREKAELAKAHGADHVILYREENTVQRVLELTEGRGVDAIFDGVGKDTFDANFEMIKRKGTIVSVGNASGAVEPFSLLRLVQKNVKILRPTMTNYIATPDEVEYYTSKLFGLIQSGDLKINIFKVYPFSAEGAQQAQSDLTGGKTTGKILIKVNPDAED